MTEQLPVLSLGDLIDTRELQPPVWVAHPLITTFKVLIRPVGSKHQEFLEQSQELKWDMATMSRKAELDMDKYLRLFVEHVIVDWQGLTVKELRKLVLLDDWKAVKRHKGEFACGLNEKLLLMRFSPSFNTWINKVCRDVELFNREREEEAEKK